MMDKGYRNFKEQTLLILERGMVSDHLSRDELAAEIEHRLRYINYYRLSAYWYPFRAWTGSGEERRRSVELCPGTTWETVWQYYLFDRRLRNILFDAISRIEIALRTRLAHHWAELHTRNNHPQSNLNCYRASFLKKKGDAPSAKEKLMQMVNVYYRQSWTDCALHYKRDYKIMDATLLPVWVFMEFTTWGNLCNLIQNGVKNDIQDSVRAAFGFQDREFFLSAVSLLREARNACAHQGRIWNIKWKYMEGKAVSALYLNDILKEPEFPEWHFRWNSNAASWEAGGLGSMLVPDKSSTAALLTLCSVIMGRIAPESHWRKRVIDLFDSSPLPDAETEIGFGCAEWRMHPLWRKA